MPPPRPSRSTCRMRLVPLFVTERSAVRPELPQHMPGRPSVRMREENLELVAGERAPQDLEAVLVRALVPPGDLDLGVADALLANRRRLGRHGGVRLSSDDDAHESE